MSTITFEVETKTAQATGAAIPLQTDVSFPWAASSAAIGVEFFDDIPESFIRAMDSFYAGRVVDADFALNNPPPDQA